MTQQHGQSSRKPNPYFQGVRQAASESRALVVQPTALAPPHTPDQPSPHIPIAQMRSLYRVADVEKRLAKLPPKEHESLRSTYERMLERGPERFQVKPSALPQMDALYDDLPNFDEVLDDVKRQLALVADSADGLEITPMLLLGEPGIGKTHFARKLAQLLGTGMGFVPMSSLTAGWILSGASSQWKGAKAGKVFETLVDGEYANPVMVIDEIDKASSDGAYDPLGALYSLLEHDTAGAFTDEFAEVAVDASQVIWIATANDERSIPEPLRNRMNVYAVPTPDFDASCKIASNLYAGIRSEHDWGKRFADDLAEAVLDALARLSPREMRRALMQAFGNARLAGRDALQVQDLPTAGKGKASIGFVH
jgi:ATP-dependent Lon protease